MSQELKLATRRRTIPMWLTETTVGPSFSPLGREREISSMKAVKGTLIQPRYSSFVFLINFLKFVEFVFLSLKVEKV